MAGYDACAGAFIHNHLDAAMQAANITGESGTLNAQAESAARSAFESAKQRFSGHLLTAHGCERHQGRIAAYHDFPQPPAGAHHRTAGRAVHRVRAVADAKIEGAVASGVYEIGLETLRAESFVVTGRRAIYTHPATGAETRLLTITERRRNRSVTLDEALGHLADPRAALLVNERSGRAAVQIPVRSLMLDDGEIERRVRLIRPMEHHHASLKMIVRPALDALIAEGQRDRSVQNEEPRVEPMSVHRMVLVWVDLALAHFVDLSPKIRLELGSIHRASPLPKGRPMGAGLEPRSRTPARDHS